MDVKTFLDLIHGAGACIYFNVGGRTWKNKPQTYHQAEPTLRWRNAEGDDIGFIVNTGGTSDRQISGVNAVFIDWDCGRDKEGHYLADDVVAQKKARFLSKLKDFTPSPSIIVETRNGYHAHWLVHPGVSPDQFRECQRLLARHFGSDPQVANPARVMRLPDYDWVKPRSGCARFRVKVIEGSDRRYHLPDILSSVCRIDSVKSAGQEEPRDGSPKDNGRICAHNKCECNTTLALIVVPKPAAKPLTFTSISDAIRYLKQQNLGNYLKLNTRTAMNGGVVRCPFHQDQHPSAGLFHAHGTGDWMFKCHACGISGTIIDMAMKVHGCGQDEALRHLFDEFRITIDTGWKGKQRQILQANIDTINNTKLIRDKYPSLYRLIGRIRLDLVCKLKFAQEHLSDGRHQHKGQFVFFASLRHFHRIAAKKSEGQRWFNRQNEKVDRYCLLGLMMKLPDSEVPSGLLEAARERQQGRNHVHRIQFYTFPAYSDALLSEADKRACKLIAAGASVRGISPELIESLFGAEMAQAVYPQRQPNNFQGRFRLEVERLVLSAVAELGYTTVAEIVAQMRNQGEWRSVTERRIQKCLPGILLKNGLVKRTCDRELKRLLRINTPGYPKVIVPSTPRMRSG